MNRRAFLGTSAAIAAGIAGCLGGTGPPAAESPTPTDVHTATDTPGDPRASFEVLDSSCGSGEDAATVTFGDGTVTVEGTIGGSDTCTRARLAYVRREDDRLVVGIGTYRPTGTTACGQCLTDIEYRAEVTVEGSLPATVVVEHDGEAVRTAAR